MNGQGGIASASCGIVVGTAVVALIVGGAAVAVSGAGVAVACYGAASNRLTASRPAITGRAAKTYSQRLRAFMVFSW